MAELVPNDVIEDVLQMGRDVPGTTIDLMLDLKAARADAESARRECERLIDALRDFFVAGGSQQAFTELLRKYVAITGPGAALREKGG